MACLDQLRHKPVEEGQQQGCNMRAVYIGICHNDDLVIAQFADIKIISVPFRETTSECLDHRLDLCVRKHFIDGCLFHI